MREEYNHKICAYATQLYPVTVEVCWAYVKEQYQKHQTVKSFMKDYKRFFEKSYLSGNFLSYNDFMEKHPILGKCHKNHAFFYRPLYRYLKLDEEDYTKALARFLNDNQESCRAFVYALINKDIKGRFKCEAEIYTEEAHKQNLKWGKFIDNIIYWSAENENGITEQGLVCLEVKIDAPLNNELNIYKYEIENNDKYKMCKNVFYLVLSKKNEKPKDPCWKNILWQNILKKWEDKIMRDSVNEDEDMKRYRSSLWLKIYK